MQSFSNTVDMPRAADSVNFFDNHARLLHLLKVEKLGSRYSRIALVMKASQPYIYHHLASAFLVETESQDY